MFSGSVKNTGDRTYGGVFIAVDGYEKDENVISISTSADLFNGKTLGPGQNTSFSKTFEDGGVKPDLYEVVWLYGVK